MPHQLPWSAQFPYPQPPLSTPPAKAYSNPSTAYFAVSPRSPTRQHHHTSSNTSSIQMIIDPVPSSSTPSTYPAPPPTPLGLVSPDFRTSHNDPPQPVLLREVPATLLSNSGQRQNGQQFQHTQHNQSTFPPPAPHLRLKSYHGSAEQTDQNPQSIQPKLQPQVETPQNQNYQLKPSPQQHMNPHGQDLELDSSSSSADTTMPIENDKKDTPSDQR